MYSTNVINRSEASQWSGSALVLQLGSRLVLGHVSWWPLSEAGHGQGWNQSESMSGSVCGQSEVTLM